MILIFWVNHGEVKNNAYYIFQSIFNHETCVGMLGAQYAASWTPKGLKHLIIVNSPASMDLCQAGMNTLLEKFPAEVMQMMHKHEAEGMTHDREYQIWMKKFYRKHICNMDPIAKVLVDSMKAMESEPTVYRTMLVPATLLSWLFLHSNRQGPSEFAVTGTLKGWTIIDILHNISCPTLLLSTPLNDIQEPAVLPFFLKIPKIKSVKFQNSAHLAHLEEPDKWIIYK